MAESTENHSLDLPLMSSIDARLVYHYWLDLQCDFEEKVFSGYIVLFSKHAAGSAVPEKKSPEAVDSIRYTRQEEILHEDVQISSEEFQCSRERESNSNNDMKNSSDKCVFDSDVRLTFKNDHSYSIADMEVGHDHKNRSCSDELFYVNKAKSTHKNDDSCVIPKLIDKNDDPYVMTNLEVDCIQEMRNGCDFDKKNNISEFVFVLDAWDIIVGKVEEVKPSQLNCDKPAQHLQGSELNEFLNKSGKSPLDFTCEKRCVRIWKKDVFNAEEFPDIVRVFYRTSPSGQSLKWTNDQDGNPCVYSHGHWINNRSWFPSQDIPQALATWKALIHAPKSMTVLMTGDFNPDIWDTCQDYRTHYFFSQMEMPSSTLGLAIGHWTEVINGGSSSDQSFNKHQTRSGTPVRVFSPQCFTVMVKDVLCPYLPKSILAAADLLGPYPFKKLDVLIVPASFNSLGMASPSLMFLSQSVLSRDGDMLVRISHEISHSWFGLLIGPKDWTEEWLSEGFCTYTEGILHAQAIQLNSEEAAMRRELMDYLKYKTLQTELNHSDVDLQTLRPNKDSVETTNTDGITYVKNGMNTDKGFLQLHYIKGYFLLSFLESLVGLDKFCGFLKQIIQSFHHQLITSQDVLLLFMRMFPEYCEGKISLDMIYEEWLDNPGLPKFITSHVEKVCQNKMFQIVCENVSQIKEVNSTYTATHWRKRRKLDIARMLQLEKMNSVQTLLLLEMLIQEKRIQPEILLVLNHYLELSSGNTDIQHKWCELVVKYRVQEKYTDVKNFLINHQRFLVFSRCGSKSSAADLLQTAMGVYLYGELVLSRDKEQMQIARAAFNAVKQDVEEGVYKTVCLMVYGTEDIR